MFDPTKLPIRISDVLNRWVEGSPDRLAIVEDAGMWTYRQLAAAISSTQDWLRKAGVRPGDRVMIVGDNCRAFAAVLLTVAGLDAWPVPVNSHLSAREIDTIREHCGARRVIYTTKTSLHAGNHALRHGALLEDVPDLGTIGISPINEAAQPEPIDTDISNRVAAVIYTSGTTGLPKGVMLTHKNLLFTASGAAKLRSLTPEDRLYGILPLSHIVGLAIVFLGGLLSGATLYLASRFDPMAARLTLEKERITIMLGVPSMFSLFLQYAKVRKLESFNFPALRIISCSGAPLAPEIKSSVERLFGLPLHHGYGITECAPSVAQVRVEGPPHSDASVGPVFPGVEVKLVGTDRQPVPAGEVGEVLVRGPNVMKGYYRAAAETASAIDTEGWFNTHDLGRFEAENLFIVGRTKDLIIRFGFNVYPAEVEAVLNSLPGVVQSAVIGRAAEGTDEIIAFVQPSPDSSLTVAEVAEYAARNLSSYKRPSHIVLLSEMPVTPTTGKIVKGELVKMAADIQRSNTIKDSSLKAIPSSPKPYSTLQTSSEK